MSILGDIYPILVVISVVSAFLITIDALQSKADAREKEHCAFNFVWLALGLLLLVVVNILSYHPGLARPFPECIRWVGLAVFLSLMWTLIHTGIKVRDQKL